MIKVKKFTTLHDLPQELAVKVYEKQLIDSINNSDIDKLHELLEEVELLSRLKIWNNNKIERIR